MPRTRHIPLRTCLACGKKRPQREMARIVRTPQGAVEVDTKGKRPGRGAYLCREQACFIDGLAKNRLEYALKTPIPAEAKEEIKQQLLEEQQMAAVEGEAKWRHEDQEDKL